VRALVLAGLGERWGHVDAALNPDLDDIAATYAAGVILVAWLGAEVVGTGVVNPRTDFEHEILRMSVATKCRRQGIGRRLLADLVSAAESAGARRIVLETTATWSEAIALYTAFGFQFSHEEEGAFGPDAYFSLALPHPAP
jgi:ribosomal protein S18 acetylase RimI-like enzyme